MPEHTPGYAAEHHATTQEKRMLNLAFVDCETTHLDAEIGEAWEVAVVLRESDATMAPDTDTEHVWQFTPDLTAADPEALRIGRYGARFSVPDGAEAAEIRTFADGSRLIEHLTRKDAINSILDILRGAALVGSNPGFDDRFLRKLLGPGSAQWHYRPIDIATLAAGYRLGQAASGAYGGDFAFPGDYPTLPYKSYDLSRAVGVEPPSPDAAHTALGDARWARDVYDAVTQGAAA